MAFVYHGTPLTPREALLAAGARGYCVSFFRPDDVEVVEQIAPFIMYDNGAFSYWMQAVRAGADPMEAGRLDWTAYYQWLDARLWQPGRWAIIPDKPAAPSQINDGLLNEWPFGTSRGSPVWHMDGPLHRLARLCERFDRVCLGWIGDPKREPVGCDAYRARMDEVAALLGNRWPTLHMLRGVKVGGDYPFVSCDSTSLAQNHHRYSLPLFAGTSDHWAGVRAYADRLERLAAGARSPTLSVTTTKAPSARTAAARASPTAAHGTGSATPTTKVKAPAFAPGAATGARRLTPSPSKDT